MKLGLDLDGTLYDSLPNIFTTDCEIRGELGYSGVPLKKYKGAFQSSDWRKFYSDLGIKEQDIDPIINLFIKKFANSEIPQIIPGAREKILEASQALGKENLYFITQEPLERVVERFKRDRLTDFISQVTSNYQGKAETLTRIAKENPSDPFIYVGDLVSDGQACLDAKKNGASNIQFYGITHPFAFSTPEAMTAFVLQHPNFTKTLNSLDELPRIWNHE